MRPLVFSASSANIAYYGEPTPADTRGRVWCEVLCHAFDFTGAHRTLKPVPTFDVRVYQRGVGRVAEFVYAPESHEGVAPLDAETITRLVREHVEL